MDDGGPGATIGSSPNAEDTSHNLPAQVPASSGVSQSRKSSFEMEISGNTTPALREGRKIKHHSMDLDDYFIGPRDLERHSKLPYFMRMHGSVTPRMILPLFLIACWIEVSSLLLTVLGFVVGLALSFRSTTAYERYSDGRKAWATLSVQSRNLARLFWTHVAEREETQGKDDLLTKLTAINLIVAFAVALKHHLRFEPYAHYSDLASLIGHLDTFAKDAYRPELEIKAKISTWKRVGNYLGMSFAASNPRKEIKRAQKPLGNLPLEILSYLSSFAEEVSSNGTMKSPIVYGQVLGAVASLTDTMSSAERVLSTPLPIGYNILISQIVLLYVYLLPFQLYGALGWITIPGTVAAAYIILGLAAIGNELENPFGNDVNDLPLDFYCDELRRDLDVLTSEPQRVFSEAVMATGRPNKVLWPLSARNHEEWKGRPIEDIREALRTRVVVSDAPGIGAWSTVKDKKLGA